MAAVSRIDNSGNLFVSGSFDEYTIPNTSYSVTLNGSSQYLTVPASTNWALGTGNFTIEWWQYQTSTGSFPRVFSVGTYPSTAVGVSIEGGTFYFWEANSFRFSNSLGAGTYLNTWIHFAICRITNQTSVYRNGTKIGSTYTDNNNINNSTSVLAIGQESTVQSGSYFPGRISNFRIIKGSGIYTGNFTPPTKPLTALANTQLLTCQSSTIIDNSINNATITNVGTVTTSGTVPFTTKVSEVSDGTYQSADILDEVTINPISSGLARKISNTGLVQVAGILDEVTGIV